MTVGMVEKQLSLELAETVIEPVKDASGRLFDAAGDSCLIAHSTHFFCHACLVARPMESQSYDSRYCRDCSNFLQNEAETVGVGKKATWRPKTPDKASNPVPKLPAREYTQGRKKEVLAHIGKSNGGNGNRRLGGRPSLTLPVERIEAMARQGMKAPGILRHLHGNGIKVSLRTVYRILSSQ